MKHYTSNPGAERVTVQAISVLSMPIAILLIGCAAFFASNLDYRFTWIHVTALACTVGANVVALLKPSKLTISALSVAGALIMAAGPYTLSNWPGGDDGPGMGWGLFVVIPSLALGAFLIVAPWVLYGVATLVRRRQAAPLRKQSPAA